MSSPGFLLANDTNHTLLQSILESLNTIVEHQYTSMLSSFIPQSLQTNGDRKSNVSLCNIEIEKEV